MTDLRQFGTCTLEDDGCTTCGDVGVPVRVVRVSGTTALGEDRTGRRAEILTDFVPDASAGDILLVHMGVAIVKVDAAAAGDLRTRASAAHAADPRASAGPADVRMTMTLGEGAE